MSQSHLSGSTHPTSSNLIGSVCSESNSSSRTSNGSASGLGAASSGPTGNSGTAAANTSNNGNASNTHTESSSNGRPSHGPRSSHHGSHKNGEHKPTRIRTVLNDKQLATLRTCYNANPRPDALMKEQLVEMTGLSPRVIRVWFQNKRCKDKKKNILMKQLQQQEKVSVHDYYHVFQCC
jgi:hypothetical protein